jgi:hypothetical protein
MRTRAVDMSTILTLAFLILAMGMGAARPSHAASENTRYLSRPSRIFACRAQLCASITRALTPPKGGFTSLT